MLKIMIFGTGSTAETFISELDECKVEIVCFVDNHQNIQGNIFLNKKVISPQSIEKYEYDYIVIASQYFDEINNQLLQLSVKKDRIIPYFVRDFIMNHEKHITNVLIKMKKSRKPNKKLSIALINYNNSNYNGYALNKFIPQQIREKYNIDLIKEKNLDQLINYNVICSSHFDGIYKKDYINIETWHGFPLKQMGLRHESTVNNKFIDYHLNRESHTQLILSYSLMYNTLFNSCFPSIPSKYKVTGIPRNDLLFSDNGKEMIINLFNINFCKVIFYLPTWRQGKNFKKETDKIWDNLFGFTDENIEKLKKYLKEKDTILIVKLHPFEYKNYEHSEVFDNKRIFLLSEELLINSNIHLYELISAADLLITDYSSIFFDTLIIDLPVVFALTDHDDYVNNRGFLMEPYEMFTPGPKSTTFIDLMKDINNQLFGADLYKINRKQIREMVHTYVDNRSTERAWLEIEKTISEVKGDIYA